MKTKLLGRKALFGTDESEVIEIPVEKLNHYHRHPFQLYDNSKKDALIRSIQENGILVPLIVQPLNKGNSIYEILAGHNRFECAKVAGLSTVPVLVKENLTNEEAEMIVVESNMLQRGFKDFNLCEQVSTIKILYKNLKKQGERTDLAKCGLTSSQFGTKLNRSDEILARNYGISRNTIARLLRLSHLNDKLLEYVQTKLISVNAGVELSFLCKSIQKEIELLLGDNPMPVSIKKAKLIRKVASDEGEISRNKLIEILVDNNPIPPLSGKKEFKVIVSNENLEKYFKNMCESEIQKIINLAITNYFTSNS